MPGFEVLLRPPNVLFWYRGSRRKFAFSYTRRVWKALGTVGISISHQVSLHPGQR